MAAKTLLELVQEFCRRRGLPQPTTVVGSQDDSQAQIWGLLNEGISDIADRFEWQHLRARYTFAHANGDEYAALELNENGPVPGYKAMLNGTLWDTLGRRRVFGPFSPLDWSAMINLGVSAAVYNFTIYANQLRIYPVPATLTADQFSMEYISNFGAFDPVANAQTLFYDTDDSYPMFPSGIILQDLKWRWSKNKGLAYAEDFRICEEMLLNLQARDPAPDIVMDTYGFERVVAPGLLVAAGSWPLP